MSQKYQPQGQSVQQPPSIGAQSPQGQTQQTGQQQQFQPAHFDEALSSEFRAALEDLSWLRKQAKWGAEQAHVRFQGSGIETTLEAISEIAELNEELILSNSKYVEYQIDTFRMVATDAIQELQQYQQEQFVEAIITDLTRAIHSVEELLATYQGSTQQAGTQTQGQMGTQSQPSQVPQQSQMQPQSQTPPQTQTQSQPYSQSQY